MVVFEIQLQSQGGLLCRARIGELPSDHGSVLYFRSRERKLSFTQILFVTFLAFVIRYSGVPSIYHVSVNFSNQPFVVQRCFKVVTTTGAKVERRNCCHHSSVTAIATFIF